MDISKFFRFCPGCGENGIEYADNKYIRCPGCGHLYFHNVAAAAGIILHTDSRVIVLERRIDPGKGLWGLPGGFLDAGESAEEGAVRECFEETGIRVRQDDLKFLVSRPNIYPYEGIEYSTCDIFFTYELDDIPKKMTIESGEVAAISTPLISDLDIGNFAFPSAKEAVRLWLTKKIYR